MTTEDFEQLRTLGRPLSVFHRIGLLSPLRGSWRRPLRGRPVSEYLVFPDATTIARRKWDVNRPARREFDLLVASSVFMYSPDPARWFAHVLAACRYFLMLDLVRRRRSADSEFGPDGDCMRYAAGDSQPRVEQYFDLDRLGNRVLGYRTYFGGTNEFDSEPVHIVALVRGDLATPGDPDAHPAAIQSVLTELSRQ